MLSKIFIPEVVCGPRVNIHPATCQNQVEGLSLVKSSLYSGYNLMVQYIPLFRRSSCDGYLLVWYYSPPVLLMPVGTNGW
jgi:hypothetical protein